MINKDLKKGAILTVIGGTCWGASGVFGQFLFQTKGFDTSWVVTLRLLAAGLIMLLIQFNKEKSDLFLIWKDKKSVIDLIIFAIFGMMAVQFTYFFAISFSNAATATVMQYLGPVMIMVYVSFRDRKKPAKNDVLAIICALLGVFIISTHGSLSELKMSPQALFWGIASAVAMAVETVQPEKLLRKWGAGKVTGYGMVIGGVVLSIFTMPWKYSAFWDMESILAFIFVVIFGTVVSFLLYLSGVKILGATKASLFACVEPLASAVLSVLWLKVRLELIDILGFVFIIATIFILAYKRKEKN